MYIVQTYTPGDRTPKKVFIAKDEGSLLELACVFDMVHKPFKVISQDGIYLMPFDLGWGTFSYWLEENTPWSKK